MTEQSNFITPPPFTLTQEPCPGDHVMKFTILAAPSLVIIILYFICLKHALEWRKKRGGAIAFSMYDSHATSPVVIKFTIL